MINNTKNFKSQIFFSQAKGGRAPQLSWPQILALNRRAPCRDISPSAPCWSACKDRIRTRWGQEIPDPRWHGDDEASTNDGQRYWVKTKIQGYFSFIHNVIGLILLLEHNNFFHGIDMEVKIKKEFVWRSRKIWDLNISPMQKVWINSVESALQGFV